ncbi:MAG: DUF2975 domain-containing protein [Dehalococcoidia bacterium]
MRHLDPFLIYGYFASTPFFFALYQKFKLLGYFGRTEVFSLPAVTAVRTIKYCALAMPVLIAAGEVFIVLNANGDDSAGAVAPVLGSLCCRLSLRQVQRRSSDCCATGSS